MNVRALILVGVLILFGIGAFVLSANSSEDDVVSTNSTQRSSNETSTPASADTSSDERLLKQEEIAVNNSKDSCWTVIDGAVYDITAYVPRHPGGSTILQACGGDGSSLFNDRQTDDGERVGSGTPHSRGASSQLSGFRIGTLDTDQE